MEPRNLRLFFPDDRATLEEVDENLLTQVNVTPFRWREVCRAVAVDKRMNFDLMSADINYTEDTSDPGDSDGSKRNSWGLTHAMFGLARRQNDDGHGNHLPLAWEIRTVSPDAYVTDKDATRAYGLLRSLAAQPLDSESLEECIHREFAEEHPEYAGQHPENPNPILLNGTLKDAFIQDLANQPSRRSEPPDAANRLLPKWRRLFWRAVGTKQVLIDIPKTKRTLDSLKKQKSPLPVRDAKVPVIAISDGQTVVDRISLFSVMADLVKKDELDVTNDNPDLLVYTGAKTSHRGSVAEWYESLLEAALGTLAGIDPAQRLLNFALRINDQLQSRKGIDALIKNLKGKVQDKGLLLILVVAHSCLHGKDFTSEKSLEQAYACTIHENLFKRPLERFPELFSNIHQASVYATELLNALKNEPHQLGDNWLWIKSALNNWYSTSLEEKTRGDSLKIPRTAAMKRAPGLFAS